MNRELHTEFAEIGGNRLAAVRMSHMVAYFIHIDVVVHDTSDVSSSFENAGRRFSFRSAKVSKVRYLHHIRVDLDRHQSLDDNHHKTTGPVFYCLS